MLAPAQCLVDIEKCLKQNGRSQSLDYDKFSLIQMNWHLGPCATESIRLEKQFIEGLNELQ
jgi:hypothetical protein